MGDFIYERFTPDRFQDFVSALMAAEYQGYQVFPVGQADGGRDGLVHLPDGPSIVIQVKFKRALKEGEDYFNWLTKSLTDEIEKVERLASAGATEYILITNVPGTAKPETGTMDKIQEFLNLNLPIPAKCYWRADLDARLAGNYDLKWFFSEILATPDVVRQLMSEGLGEDRERRHAAVTGYMRSQYETDAYVKFKQAELQASDLLNLFVDVPGQLGMQVEHKSGTVSIPNNLRRIVTEIAHVPNGSMHFGWASRSPDPGKKERPRDLVVTTPPLPAGSMLLHSAYTEVSPRTVVEGAPGQGKSTLAQYVCQVHRMIFLNRENDLTRIPGEHRLTPSRVPFKVDLRDLSQWLDGIDHRKAVAKEPHGRPASLETFLAHEVEYLSGGQSFDASDLHALARAVPLLIVLDGFDEVATPSQRLKIVEEVDRALSRLEDSALSIQAVVTSRPSALPDSPRFPAENWQYLVLDSISKPLALEYAGRWAKARRLDPQERSEIEAILAVKLESPHLRDLARNPMQLTILLTLIHLRGQSLPDQRTAMYDSYIEVFFNREAEKTAVVRDNRQLLIDLHGFLAWKMHSDAEAVAGDGRISTGELRENIQRFLSLREYPSDAVDALFEGVIQRIVALVSRTEGTFEFEVQPLREYFAAHHLYHTSPYSPPGKPVPGTKPEILAALVSNPYWQNVLRFFAGFYSAGELPGLASDLITALEDPGMANPIYHRKLAVNLLSDWVFHQSPVWTRKLVEAAIDPLALRTAQGRQDPWRTAELTIELPVDCGGRRAAEIALEHLPFAMTYMAASNMSDIAKRNLDLDDVATAWWKWAANAGPAGNTALLRTAEMLGVIQWFTEDDLSRLEGLWPDYEPLRIDVVLHGGLNCCRNDTDQKSITQTFLDGYAGSVAWAGEWAEMSWCISPQRFTNILLERPDAFYELGSRSRPAHVDTELLDIVHSSLDVERRYGPLFSSRLDPWQEIVEIIGRLQGEVLLQYVIGTIAAGIVSSRERGSGCSQLFKADDPLTKRCRYARMQSGRPEWWLSQYEAADTDVRRQAWAILCLSWGSTQVQDACGGHLDEVLNGLPETRITSLAEWISTLRISVRKGSSKSKTVPQVQASSLRRYFILATAGSADHRRRFIAGERKAGFAYPPYARAQLMGWALQELPARPSAAQWDSLISELERLSKGILLGRVPYWDAMTGRHPNSSLSPDTSREILKNALRMPLVAITAADWRLSVRQSRLRPLASIAADEQWSVG